MGRRNNSGSKSLSEYAMEQEQGSGSEAALEISDSDSNCAAVNTSASRFTQSGPECKNFPSVEDRCYFKNGSEDVMATDAINLTLTSRFLTS